MKSRTAITTRSPEAPAIVSADVWQRAHERFLKKEKAATRARDALAAERRRLPWLRIEKPYTFTGPEGRATFTDLFAGRRQLLLYHFMFAPGDEEGCVGCSMFVDNLGHLAHLHERDTSLVLVSRAPLPELRRFQRRMGWQVPWFSSYGTDFNTDFGVTDGDDESFALSAFIREGDEIYRTYYTDGRGIEAVGTVWSLLDLTPLGRQEDWENSPPGTPQTPPFRWWRHHDRYR